MVKKKKKKKKKMKYIYFFIRFETVQKDSTLSQIQRLNNAAVTTRTILVIINNTYTNNPPLNSEMTQFRPDIAPNCSIANCFSCIKKTGASPAPANTRGLFYKCIDRLCSVITFFVTVALLFIYTEKYTCMSSIQRLGASNTMLNECMLNAILTAANLFILAISLASLSIIYECVRRLHVWKKYFFFKP